MNKNRTLVHHGLHVEFTEVRRYKSPPMYSTRDASTDLSTQPPTVKLQLPDAWMFYKNGLFVAIIDAEHTVTNPSGPRPSVTEQLKLECTMHSDIFQVFSIVTPSQLLQRIEGNKRWRKYKATEAERAAAAAGAAKTAEKERGTRQTWI